MRRAKIWLCAPLIALVLFAGCNRYDEVPFEYALFDALRGRAVRTGGWADYANNGQGIAYTNPDYPIVICDCDAPNPIAKMEAFVEALGRTEPTFIIVCGDIDLSRGRIGYANVPPENIPASERVFLINADTTIIGINDARLMFGGLQLDGRPGDGRAPVQNVIIRNITFWDAVDYDLNLDKLLLWDASGVWVNHNRFTAGTRIHHRHDTRWHDDTLNIREGQITASWNVFYNLDRTILVGSNDGATNPEDRRVTLHHNLFRNVHQRVPRTRGTLMHIYNNYFADANLYVMGPGINARFVVQNNLFDTAGARGIVDWGFPHVGAVIWSEGNVAGPGIAGITAGEVDWGTNDDRAKPWEPGDFYEYILAANVEGLRQLIPERAGPTLRTIDDFTAGLRD